MSTYSTQQKESSLQKMMPPNNISISKLSIEMGIGESTLYNWRKQAIDKGHLVPLFISPWLSVITRQIRFCLSYAVFLTR